MDALDNMILMGEQYKPKYGMLMDGEYYIKVNIPSDKGSYATGNGEGCWFIVSESTCRDHDNDAVGGGYEGTLANDSVYYPGLNCGELVPFEMRGGYRPVVPISWLEERYGKSVW